MPFTEQLYWVPVIHAPTVVRVAPNRAFGATPNHGATPTPTPNPASGWDMKGLLFRIMCSLVQSTRVF